MSDPMTRDPADEPEGEGYELVVPFIACISHGGPYDDDAFVAGFQAGQIDQALKAAVALNVSELRVTVYSALIKQLELIAMNHGFPVVLARQADDAPDWSYVTFRPDQPDEEAR